MTAALVYYKNLRAGILRKTKDGYEFAYDENYLSNPQIGAISFIQHFFNPLESINYHRLSFKKTQLCPLPWKAFS